MIVPYPSLELLRNCLGMVLAKLLYLPLPEQGLDQMIPRGPSCDLVPTQATWCLVNTHPLIHQVHVHLTCAAMVLLSSWQPEQD